MRILRKTTIKNLSHYFQANQFKCPESESGLHLNDMLMNENIDAVNNKKISELLFECFGTEETNKLMSKMSSYLNRQKFKKVSIEIHADTKKLLDQKLKELEYSSIDDLLNDALNDFDYDN